MARMDAMTIKMDTQYKELQSRAKQPTPDLNDDDMPMSRVEEAKFMQTFCKTWFYNDYRDRDSNLDNFRSSRWNDYHRDNYRSNTNDKPYDPGMPNYENLRKELIRNKHKIEQISVALLSDDSSAMIQNKVPPKLRDPGSFLNPCNFKTFSCNALADLGASINLMPYSLYVKLSLKTLKPTKMSVRLADKSFQYPVGIAENMLVEGDEGNKVPHSIKGTLPEEEIFTEFNEFMAMTTNENSESESDTKEPPFEKITINTDYKIKTSLEEPPTDLELKPFPDNLEYEDPPPKVSMADNRTMAELLQAPTEGYEDAIVIPKIIANNFELKHGLINLVQNKQLFGHDKEDPHAHSRYFNNITSTMRSQTYQFFPPSKTTNLRNEITRFQQRFDESFYEAWDRFNDLLRACPHHGFCELHQLDTFYNALNVNYQDSLNSAAGENLLDKIPRECLKIIESKSKDLVRALLLDKKNQSSAPVSSPTPAPVKAVEPNCVTYGGTHSYQNCPATSGNVYRDNIQENQGDQGPSANPSSQSTASVRPLVSRSETPTPISKPVVAPVSAPMPIVKSSIPYPSRRDNERRTLIGNKEKLSEMARTPMNKHCLAVILNKFPRKLRVPNKFLIPCEFPGMDECLSLADLGASINLMPLCVWEALSLLELTPTCMTLELVDRSISKPIGIAKDISFKVGVFHFLADFVVVDFEPDPRVRLILERNEAITYNLDQTMRYSANYNQMTANKIDVICEEYSQEVLGFSDVTTSGNPIPHDDPLVSTTSPTLIPFGDSDFLLFDEADAFLGLEDDPNSLKINPFYYDPEGDILLLEAILNSAFTVVENEENELIPTRLVTGWRVCIDYRKLNEATRKDHFPLPFMDQMLKRLPGNEFYCFLDGFSGYFQIPINPRDQEKTTFTCLYRMFAHRRMPFGLCNAPGTFQRCMLAIFHDMVEKTMDEFMDDFLVFGNSFENCLSRLDKILQRCEDTNLSLNWEKSHFMVKEGIILGHKISKNKIKVDRAKVDVIAKLLHPITIKDCIKAFQTLKKKLTEAPILIAPNWDLPFELMCDTSNLGQRHEKHFKPIYYARKIMNDAKSNYSTTEKEMLAIVYAFEKFRSYLIMNKSIVHTDHSALKYLFAKKDAKARLFWWVLLLQEFNFKVLDTKGAENLTANHLS
nr:reverse transcriptase domain-containing protein [Tanacetum cinerariifolium]